MGYSLARTWVTGQILGGVALGVGGTEGGRSPTGVPPTPNATVGCLVTTSDLWPTPHEAPGESLSTRKRPRPRAPGPRRERFGPSGRRPPGCERSKNCGAVKAGVGHVSSTYSQIELAP